MNDLIIDPGISVQKESAALQQYLHKINLDNLSEYTQSVHLNTIVQDAFTSALPDLTDIDIQNLYEYDIPQISPDGTCSITDKKNDAPYNLARTLGYDLNPQSLRPNLHTLRLWRLKQVISQLYALSDVNWSGVYRKATNPQGELVLVKESYQGLFSRPEFPLTEEFARKSNNSTVGLTGKAIVIQSVAEHAGPYYQCDGAVNSEFCVPILDPSNEVIGIIDAESFKTNHFSPEILLQITKVAMDLGKENLGL